MPLPRRLRRLPTRDLPGDVRLIIAATPGSRLLGLMGLARLDRRDALLLPRCRAVHTFGMRFALDLIWLDAEGRVLRTDRAVAPGRLRSCRRAHSVIETAAGGGKRSVVALAASGEGPLVVGSPGRRRAARGLLDQAGAEGRRAPQLSELR